MYKCINWYKFHKYFLVFSSLRVVNYSLVPVITKSELSVRDHRLSSHHWRDHFSLRLYKIDFLFQTCVLTFNFTETDIYSFTYNQLICFIHGWGTVTYFKRKGHVRHNQRFREILVTVKVVKRVHRSTIF